MLSYNDFDELLDKIGLENTQEKQALEALFATLSCAELTSDQAQHVLEIFSLEGLQQLESTPENVLNAQWEEFNYGNVKIGDFVRVKDGIYQDSESGAKHAGRIGVLVAMAKYRCSVRYIGLHPSTRIIHPMENLQSMKRK